MEIYTIGFAGKSAESFFGLLKASGIRRLIDIRLNNTSQLAGFTKADNLPFFLKKICDADYIHEPLLAPTELILANFKKEKGTWEEFERGFLLLMDERCIAERLDRALFDRPAVLLCSESTPERCHRRLAAEYLKRHWKDISIVHL